MKEQTMSQRVDLGVLQGFAVALLFLFLWKQFNFHIRYLDLGTKYKFQAPKESHMGIYEPQLLV